MSTANRAIRMSDPSDPFPIPVRPLRSGLESLAFLVVSVLMAGLAADAAFAQPAQPVVSSPRDVSSIISPILDKSKLPGLAAVVIEGNAIVAQGVAGVRAAGSPEAITINDTFHIGSCTKSMTATMLATLVEEGKMRWETTIAEVFGEEAQNWNEGWRDVTLEQLVCHRAGVPGNIPPPVWAKCWKMEGTPTEQRLMLTDALLREPPKSKPGEKFEYANAGFSIAGAMAEKLTGKAWEVLMRERLFTPLKMSSAGFGAPGAAGTIDQPRGHRASSTDRGSWIVVEPGPGADNPPAIGPGGTCHMSLPDWAKYVSAHIVGERGGSTLLKPATFESLHKPPNGWAYGCGWSATRRPWAVPRDQPDAKDGRVITHNGSNTMWYCVVWAAPERGFAVLVATNAAGDVAAKSCDDVAAALIKDQASHQGTGAKQNAK